ncbi:hypothetical protein ACFUJR_38370 [Streptomyces sp. NPDC057271]|uniref:hypothetical protein n=1 Tax=unclassified Streptomyces TaxID=2593676 RepID=UPI003633A295
MSTPERDGELLVVDSEVPVPALAPAIWDFLTRSDGRGMRDIIQGSDGLEKENADITEVGYRFTEFFTDPDTEDRVPCTWRTVMKSPSHWHLVAEDFLYRGLTIHLDYSVSGRSDDVHLRRRMRTWVPAGTELTTGWWTRLGDQKLADQVARKIAAGVAEQPGRNVG